MAVFELIGWSHHGAWFPIFPLLWLALLVGVFFVFRGRRGRWQVHSAEEILAERYARGEITVEEYRQRLDALKGKRS